MKEKVKNPRFDKHEGEHILLGKNPECTTCKEKFHKVEKQWVTAPLMGSMYASQLNPKKIQKAIDLKHLSSKKSLKKQNTLTASKDYGYSKENIATIESKRAIIKESQSKESTSMSPQRVKKLSKSPKRGETSEHTKSSRIHHQKSKS